jgi:NAD(P)-dependent dehydrogenase (short-subunit alcohol dehydrogenase family)
MPKHPFDLTGQVAVITGSSKGIGRSIAEVMAEMGAKVVVSSRKADACEAVAASIRAKGGEAIVIPCNIGRKEDCEALVKGAIAKWGRIDAMVCNAAINPHYGPLATIADEVFDKMMASNIKSNLWLANMVAPGMAERGGGTITIISSIGGLKGSDKLGAYAVSKAGDFGLARSLAVEWGPKNVRVNSIAPGLVKTDFARALWEDPVRLAKSEQLSPLRRLGQPHDIGGVAAFLASPAAAFITGQVIVADGGTTIV